jgi:hypothetical protein
MLLLLLLLTSASLERGQLLLLKESSPVLLAVVCGHLDCKLVMGFRKSRFFARSWARLQSRSCQIAGSEN